MSLNVGKVHIISHDFDYTIIESMMFVKGCTHRLTMALDEWISMHRKCSSICGYTYPLRFLLFSI